MVFNNPYWSNKLKMETLQRWIIVHSYLYYEVGNSIISDRMFDNNARQLVAMQEQFPEEAEETQYWYCFYDFDANTGFHLYYRLNEHDKKYLTQIAQHVLSRYKSERRKRRGKQNSKNGRR